MKFKALIAFHLEGKDYKKGDEVPSNKTTQRWFRTQNRKSPTLGEFKENSLPKEDVEVTMDEALVEKEKKPKRKNLLTM